MKSIEVVAAIIKKDNKYFATQRAYGDFEGGWEFPGGKMEPGETPQDALIREIKEELDADITVGELVETVRLASAPSAPLFRFLQCGFLRFSTRFRHNFACCFCIFRLALDDFNLICIAAWLFCFSIEKLAASLAAFFALFGVHAPLSRLCAIYPVFFVRKECSAHCFCFPTHRCS